MNTLNGYSKSTLTDKYVLTAAGGHLAVGNAKNNIPLNNGTVNTNLNADLLDGLHIHTGRNNEANKIVRTDTNGFIQAGWINTTSGAFTGTPSRIYASNDAYIRYMTPANFFPTLTNTSNLLDITIGGLNRKLTIDYSKVSGSTKTLDYKSLPSTTSNASNTVWCSFARIAFNTGAWVAANGYIFLGDAESYGYSGILYYEFRSSSTATAIGKASLLWLVKNKDTASIIAVKVKDNIYDLYINNYSTYSCPIIYHMSSTISRFTWNVGSWTTTKPTAAYTASDTGRVNYANSANSATQVIVNLHTSNNTEYPLIWSNSASTSTTTGNLLYKSYSHLTYNPSAHRISTGQYIANNSSGPHFTAQSTTGNWAYLRLNNGSTYWDIATRSDSGSGGLWLARLKGADNGIFVSTGNSVGISTSSPSDKFHVNGGQIRSTHSSRYLRIGPQNSSHAHYETDADISHWFNKRVEVNGHVNPYSNNSFTSGTSDKRWSNVYSVLGNFTGNVTLYSASGDSPHLYFLRGTTTDGTYDWDMFVTGGSFTLRQNNGGTWNTALTAADNYMSTGWRFNVGKELSVKDQRFNYGLAYYNTSTSTVTGTIVITLPNGWTNAMNTYEIDIYEYIGYDEDADNVLHSKLIIDGYNYSGSSAWINYGYTQIGSYNKGVRLGYNGSKCVIMLGTTSTKWSYPQVHLSRVITGYSNQTAWSTGYSISVITSESGYSKIVTVNRVRLRFDDVVANNFRGNLVGTASNADTLDGIHANGLLTALSSNTTNKISLTVGGTTKNITTLYASYLCSVGTVVPLTGRTQAYGNVYSYHTNARAWTGAPTTYTATIGFGKGTGGTVEICGEWTSGRGLWVRALRDTIDDWYAWDRILTEATYSKVLDNRYYTETEVNNKLAGYLPLSGGTMTGNIKVYTDGDGRGLKFGTSTLNSLSNQLLWQSAEAIRFGSSSWDWNAWAGLKYNHSSKIIYLGLADGTIFNANSGLSGGKLYLPGISVAYVGNGTYKILHLGNSSVSGGGSSGGSSITVNIGGTSKTLTIPTSLPANGGTATQAGSADWLNTNSKLEYGASGLNYFNLSGTAGNTKANNTPNAGWHHILRMNHGNTAGYLADIAVPINNVTGIYWRLIRNGTFYGWYKVLDNNNSSVSGGGSSWGSSITVNIGGTSKTLTIPSNPNTHWTTRIYAGASGTAANAAATNPYLKVTDDNTYRNLVRFVGGGATTVSSDASGNITISSTNTTYDLGISDYTVKINGTTKNFVRDWCTATNMNAVAKAGRSSVGMANLSTPSGGTATAVNPNGQTSWHHFINLSYSDGGGGSNAWVTQIANKAGSTDLWVRSRSGGTISDTANWTAGWTRILTGTNYSSVLNGRYYTKTESDTRYVNTAGDTMTGTLTMYTTGTGSYNHGIRINRVKTSDWALILIGKSGTKTEGTGTSTAGDGAWLIGTPASSNSLIFNLNDASESKGLCLKGHGASDMKWNNNTVWHAGNDGSGSGLDADLLDGKHASAFATSGHNHDASYVKYAKVSKSTADSTNAKPYIYNVESETVISGYYSYWYILNLGLYSGGNFGTQLAMPYQDSLTDSELFIRSAKNGSWRTWRRVLHDGNSAVTKSGQTLTVTINGTSQSLTNSTYNFSGTSFTSGNQNTAEHDANNITSNGHWYYSSNGPSTSIGATTADGALYSQAYSTSWVGQIAQDYRDGDLFTRGKKDGTWTAWKLVAYALDFVKKSGDTLSSGTSQIQRAGSSVSWYLGRSNAMIRINSYSGYNAIASMKTTNGDWSLGVYANNVLYFTYITDTNFNASTNTTTALVYINASGNVYATHFYEHSDINLKTNIKSIITSDNIPQLKSFDWKSDGSHSYGLIAQELEELGYSELVSNEGGLKTVKYSAALSLIVGKLQVKIRELEKEIEILKNKN